MIEYEEKSEICGPERNDLNIFVDVMVRFSRFYGSFSTRICADAGYGSLYNYYYLYKQGIEKVSTEIMLNVLVLNIAKLFRFYSKRKLNTFWVIPADLRPQHFKKPSLKKLIKKGYRINKIMFDNSVKTK